MRFPWSSMTDRAKPAAASKVAQPTMLPPSRPTPVVEVPTTNKLKRARINDDEARQARGEKRSRRKPGPTSTAPSDHHEGALVEQQWRTEGGAQASPPRKPKPKQRPGANLQPKQPREAAKEDLDEEAAGPPNVPALSSLTPLQQSIESQFSLEILLKHQELRLIEQELAKCQAAYEQLRRCQLTPYVNDSPYATPADNGAPAGSHSEAASSNTSWRALPGVTDGPYTRHYKRWLIPDPRFDGPSVLEDGTSNTASPTRRGAEGRATRASAVDGDFAGMPRPRGAAAAAKLHPLTTGHTPSKDKNAPLVLKRSSDGQYVKLVCLDCSRGDFSSAQGFINHCRIAHHRGFESHDAAASACGQVVEVDLTGSIIGDEDGSPGGPVAFVHPLIRVPSLQPTVAADARREAAAASIRARAADEKSAPRRLRGSDRARVEKGSTTSKSHGKGRDDFVPSPYAPHLSALMEHRGLRGDLGQMVGEAKETYDLGVYSSDEEESEDAARTESQDQTPVSSAPAPFGQLRAAHGNGNGQGPPRANGISSISPAGRTPARSGMSPAPLNQSNSHKGRESGRPADAANRLSARAMHAASAGDASASTGAVHARPPPRGADGPSAPSRPSRIDPSLHVPAPYPTTAPSLVSDDDDVEVHSESETPESDADEAEYGVQFDVEDGDDGGQSDETIATDPDLAHPPPAGIKDVIPRRTALRSDATGPRARRAGREQRHVTFMSPVREPEVKGRTRARGGGRRNARR
ncbi:MAG: hypothetical protein M1838_003560 [Thelocarpon superellum]|nr:MAG: hypothetical protein M1838_003560 [Thelocarpon superellum]